MLISETHQVPEGSRTNKKRRYLVLKCNSCGTVFERWQNAKLIASKPQHYCCNECFKMAMRSGGCADARRRITNDEKYGVPYYISKPEVASMSGKAAHTPELELQRWDKIKRGWADGSTVLKRGLTLVRSRVEREFFDRFSRELGLEVETQKHVNGWFIDGHVKDVNIYVQFDGVYWHSRADAIARDVEQNEWFAKNGFKLVRITDREYSAVGFDISTWWKNVT